MYALFTFDHIFYTDTLSTSCMLKNGWTNARYIFHVSCVVSLCSQSLQWFLRGSYGAVFMTSLFYDLLLLLQPVRPPGVCWYYICLYSFHSGTHLLCTLLPSYHVGFRKYSIVLWLRRRSHVVNDFLAVELLSILLDLCVLSALFQWQVVPMVVLSFAVLDLQALPIKVHFTIQCSGQVSQMFMSHVPHVWCSLDSLWYARTA